MGALAVGGVVAGGFAVGAIGCSVQASTDAGPPPPPPPGPVAGSLTLRWTVDEVTDPNVCIMGGAAAIDVVLHTTDGGFAGEFQQSCTNFQTTIAPLTPSGYVGSAILIDAGGRQRTTAVTIQPFNIIDGTNLVVDSDFPANSFL